MLPSQASRIGPPRRLHALHLPRSRKRRSSAIETSDRSVAIGRHCVTLDDAARAVRCRQNSRAMLRRVRTPVFEHARRACSELSAWSIRRAASSCAGADYDRDVFERSWIEIRNDDSRHQVLCRIHCRRLIGLLARCRRCCAGTRVRATAAETIRHSPTGVEVSHGCGASLPIAANIVMNAKSLA